MNTNKLNGKIVERFGSQKQFSVALGWHKNKISLIIRKKRLPNVNEVADMSRVLQLSLEEHAEIFLHSASPNGDCLFDKSEETA